MRIDNPSISGSLSFIGGNNSISATSVNLTGSFSGSVVGTFEGGFSSAATTEISGAFDSVSSSLASRVASQESFSSSLDNTFATDAQVSTAVSSLNAATSSYLQNTTDTLTGDLTVTGTLTAQDLHVQEVTSSVVFSSGSNIFGENVSDTQKFTGSLQVSGSTNYLLGSVGIGTTSPVQKLDVEAGHISVDAGYGLVWSGDVDRIVTPEDNTTGGLFKVASGAATRFMRASSESMRIDGNGNLGIGTDSPDGPLHISFSDTNTGYANASGVFITNTNTTTNNRAHIFFSDGGAGAAAISAQFVDHTNDYGDLLFSTRDSGGFSDRMRITSNGNVGIGTTSPSGLLTVHTGASGTYDAIILSRDTYGEAGVIKQAAGGLEVHSQKNLVLGADEDNIFTGTSSNIIFKVDGSEAARFNSGLSLGIGTTSPADILDVRKNQNATTQFFFRNTDTTNATSRAQLVLEAGSTSLNLLAINGDNTYIGGTTGKDFYIQEALGGNVQAIFKSNGNVGIGTTSPSGKLDVRAGSGGKMIFGSYDANYNVTIQGGNQIDFYNGASTANGYINYLGGGTGISQNLFVEKGSAGTAGTVRINSAGKVGIGTTSPISLLHIKGTGDAIRVESTNTGAGGAQMDLLHFTTSPANDDVHGVINFGGYYSGTSSAYGSSIQSIWTNAANRLGRIAFLTRNGADFNTVMTINHASNVGIGTTGPTTKLHINGSSAHLQFTGGNNRITYSGHRALEGSHDGATLQVGEGYTKTLMYGKVGIATTSPQGGIHVKGNPIVVDDGYQNHQTMIYTSGQSGTYNGSFTFETPETGNGANSVGYGGYVCEIYISGYDGKYCHAIFSGYINNGISAGEATILRSSSGWSISQSQKSGTYQGLSFVVDYPSGLVHPCARIFFTKGGDNANAGYDLTNVTTTWS